MRFRTCVKILMVTSTEKKLLYTVLIWDFKSKVNLQNEKIGTLKIDFILRE